VIYILLAVQILSSLLAGYFLARARNDKSKSFRAFGSEFTLDEVAFGYMFLIAAFMTIATGIMGLREASILITWACMTAGLYIVPEKNAQQNTG